MKESSEDAMMKNIKEVLEQYEPDYSPQFWENLRKQRPMPEFRIKNLLLKYKFWLSCIATVGGLVIVYMNINTKNDAKYPAIDPVFPESSYYFPSEKPKEIAYSEKITAISYSTSDIGIDREEKDISPNIIPIKITDSMSVVYQDNTPAGDGIDELPGIIENDPVNPVLLKEADFGSQCNILQLIPIKYHTEEIPALKSFSSEKKSKIKFQWPGSVVSEEGSYDRFTGPTRLAVFYSPEIHYSDSLSKLGVSQGAGISFEGSIRSDVTISAGLSYQSMNFNVTISSVKVPPEGPFQPGDTLQTINNIDSTEIRSGSYRFLELPVAVNFKFLESPRSQVWLSAGISAIAFLQQDYTYETVVDGISTSSSVSVKAWENIHPLASFNIGLLYRYKLSDRFSLHGLAQYKQHLVPLGYNSMKLNRLNFQAGIIYRFGHKY
jgi:hypothetical protein